MRLALATVLVSGCSFSGPELLAIDASSIDAGPDAAPARMYWAVVASDTGPNSSFDVLPFDALGFTTSCTRQPIAKRTRTLKAHPTLPYIYAAGLGLQGVAVGCTASTATSLPDIGNFRSNQTVTLDGGVGFFTIDGPGPNGVYRFTIAADGTPTVAGGTASPAASGPAVQDAAAKELFVGGNVVFRWVLDPPDQQFGAPTDDTVCGEPVDLLLSGSALLAFCADVPDIQHYTRSPIVRTGTVGSLGAVERVIPLPGDRAIAALIAPPALVDVALHGGAPTFTTGPALASRITAMAASDDGAVVVTVRSIDAATSEVALWRISASGIAPLATKTVTGTATAVAVVHPGS